ncbi:hypothetical protein SMD22_00720 (plasmid) [Brevibacillus halotolerans]|nr:hypothetical protein SMD22_00720 [Brevibacillus halotolerans]
MCKEKDTAYHEELYKWEKIVNPYIESLPFEKKEIVFIKIDTELESEVSGHSVWGIGYTNSAVVERTPLTISFKDGENIITRTIEYQGLKVDLGHGFEPGIYNAKVYLPQSYSFTNLK